MASILDKYGIKEVADVTFYKLDNQGKPSFPVLYLDTLKVSTIEQTGETSEAKGGKGNASLIMWDYGKEINVSIEDALFSAKSMAIMFGNGSVSALSSGNTPYNADSDLLMKTKEVKVAKDEDNILPYWVDNAGKSHEMINPKVYDESGTPVAATFTASSGENKATLVLGTAPTADARYFVTYDIAITGSVIEISASSFPGTYYVTGDTYARSQASGDDEFFQFIIPKAKVQSENTITLEAEGDPSVFNMSLRVLRPDDGVMMKLVKYSVNDTGSDMGTASELYHNHDLLTAEG